MPSVAEKLIYRNLASESLKHYTSSKSKRAGHTMPRAYCADIQKHDYLVCTGQSDKDL